MRSEVSRLDSLTSEQLMKAFNEINRVELNGSQRISTIAKDKMNIPGANPREIFSNSELHLDKIKVVGFDYDFTLASYRTDVQRFIYDEARNCLIDKYRYPSELSRISYDKNFAIRGLTFDTEHVSARCY